MKRFSFSSGEKLPQYEAKQKRLPLHRSITTDSGIDIPSPITRFVCKLLGLPGPSPARSWHKSRSTTSITKSSVMSFYPVLTSSNSTPMTSTTTTPTEEKSNLSPSNSSSSSSEPEEIDDTSSILSSLSSNCTINSSCSAASISAAVDALISASLLPTKPRRIKFSDFQMSPCIKLENRKPDTTAVMTQDMAELIRPYIPGRHRIASKWTLLYSIDQHGVSLNTLYSSMANRQGPCIMIIKDTENQIFGSYQSDAFSCQPTYYGTGECFLWKLSQVEHTNHPVPKIKVFPWTGKNDYMILSDSDEIAIGGGDGEFGLWLHSDLEHGYSHPCATFDNDYLANHAEFQCLGMEVWGFCI